MSYPTAAYRGGQRRALPSSPGSSQSPAGVPPRPANDNWPGPMRTPVRPPTPANDNAPGFRGPAKKTIRSLRRLSRINPFGKYNQLWELGKFVYNATWAQQNPYGLRQPDLKNGWGIAFSCCTLGPQVTSTDFLFSRCGTPCAVAPAGGARPWYIQPGYPLMGSWWDSGAKYTISQNQAMIANGIMYERSGPGSASFALHTPMAFSNPAIQPMLDPWAPASPNMPQARPVPRWMLPYRQPNPFLSPSEQTQWGNAVAGAVAPSVGFAIGIKPGVGVRPVTPHKPAPPGPGVKEKKGALRKGMAVALKGAYAATEAIDAIDAVHKALPKKYQAPKGSTPQEKLAAIYKNIQHLDMNQALLNLVANHFLDLIIGRGSARVDEIMKSTGSSGWNTVL